MRFGALGLVLLTGCWPLIPGKHGGGTPAESALIVGELQHDTYLGQYWNTTGTTLTGWVAVFQTPQAVFTIEAYGEPNGCTRNPALPTWWSPTTFATDGSGIATFGSSTVASSAAAPWSAANARFESAASPGDSAVLGDMWGVSGVNAGGFGVFNLEEAAYLPSAFTLTSPALDTAEPISLGFGDVPLAWTGADDADEMVVQVFMFDETDAAIELIECRAPNTGSFTVPLGTISTEWANASYAILTLGAVAQMDRKVDFHEAAGNRMVGMTRQHGVFFTN